MKIFTYDPRRPVIMKRAAVFCTLILMLVLMGATGCQSHSQNQQPIEVTSVLGPLQPYIPAGPIVGITLKNLGEEPVIYLKATLELERAFEFEFVNVTPSNPLLPNKSISDKLIIGPPGGGFDNNLSYPLTINATLQSGATFVYTKQVQIVNPLANK